MVTEGVWGRRAIAGGLLVVSSWLAGCAQPSSTSAPAQNEAGTLAVSLTDKPGDFATYAVQVSDLTLTHADGAVVHTIAQPVLVDFAQYVQVSEFLTLLPVRHGHYTKATMTLDYTHANIQVEGNNGKPVAVGADKILGTDGMPITTLTVDVQLDGPTALTIAPGLLRHLHLDFDLAATNTVTFDADGVPTVSVEPTLIAEVDPHQFKEHRLRGLLQSVDAEHHSFELEMRPFLAALSHKKAALHDRDDHKLFGAITVQTTDQTKFTINGVDVANSNGLIEMNKMARPARVVVKGTPKFNPLRIEAAEVDARTLDVTPDHAALEGTVIKRVTNTLTVRGAVEDTNGDVSFGQDVEVVLTDTTAVSTWRPNVNPNPTIANISIGQHLHVAGLLNAEHKIDAAKVHLQATLVAGTVKGVTAAGVTPAIATLNVSRINGIAIAAFDFTGTGKDTAHDAKGGDYTVNLGHLSANYAVDAPVRVVGNPVAFGAADTFAFDATTAVNLSGVPVLEEIRWESPTAMALTVAAAHDVITPVVGMNDRFAVTQAGIKLNPSAPPAIHGAVGEGVYIIQQPAKNALYRNFADFAAALAERLGAGAKVKSLRASGTYNGTDNVLSATAVSVSLSKK